MPEAAQVSLCGKRLRASGVAKAVEPTEIRDECALNLDRSWTERAYPKLIYFNKLDKGGHFAAWGQPELFCAEMRAAFRPLRGD